ncbi:M23 family metallopeptidase [Spongiibacter taiwanensis]|uniref:peptidoglycan DD-metalloendopeptidase family protein n=1 Tax=Spongiibacter taiwanensis TaxID=1748242 RepID=UPI00203522FF|nr:M23 family metallopeptidase [Spongiibacter taiwanensis]USA44538.1 M23 family metallopeptidase [Spongiibacter taiwanensis]
MARIAIFLFIVLTSSQLAAKQLYKYQDENGQWHFTDQKPVNRENVQQQQLTVSEPKKLIRAVNRGSKLHPRFYVVNEYYGPVEIEFSVTKQENVSIYPRRVVRMTVPPRGESFVLGIKALREHGWNYQTLLRKVIGDPTSEPDVLFAYGQPFPEGRKFRVSQGFNGQRSHKGEENRYAVDISLPVGTPILAVRDGMVMSVNQDFDIGGYQDKFRNKANQIMILHRDGTIAIYAHLQLESIPVGAGQAVKRGQVIGRSGNTGFSSGPHLHFEIHQNLGMKGQSVPFYFVDSGGGRVTPNTGVWLTGSPAIGSPD